MTDIRGTLKHLGITQAQAAGLLGISVRTIERWCSGRTPPWAPMMMALLDEDPSVSRRVDRMAATNQLPRAPKERRLTP